MIDDLAGEARGLVKSLSNNLKGSAGQDARPSASVEAGFAPPSDPHRLTHLDEVTLDFLTHQLKAVLLAGRITEFVTELSVVTRKSDA